MIGRKRVGLPLVQSENAKHCFVGAQERDCECGGHAALLTATVAVGCFNRRVAVQNRFAVLRNPASQSLAYGYLKRRQDAKVVTNYVFGNQLVIAQQVDGRSVVRHELSQAGSYQREGFMQAQRASQITAELEQSLGFASSGNNRSKKIMLPGGRFCGFETRGGSMAVCNLHVGGKLFCLGLISGFQRSALEILITPLQDFDDTRIELSAGTASHLGHSLGQGQAPAVLAIGGERIETVDGCQDARTDGYFLSLQSVGITGTVPALVVRA